MATTQLISHEQLRERYTFLSRTGTKPLGKRTLNDWRKNKDFPAPIIRLNSLQWDLDEVQNWEKIHGYDKFL